MPAERPSEYPDTSLVREQADEIQHAINEARVRGCQVDAPHGIRIRDNFGKEIWIE